MTLGGYALEHGRGLGLRLPYHHRHTLLDDAGLLACDGLQRVAEELGVVKPDVGDDGEQGGDDVGAVQAPAHADLDDGDVDLLAGVLLLHVGADGQVTQGS